MDVLSLVIVIASDSEEDEEPGPPAPKKMKQCVFKIIFESTFTNLNS